MAIAEETAWLDATAHADLVRRREVTATELVEVALSRIELLDPKLNAIVTTLSDLARERALIADKVSASETPPFHGVPFLHKDLGCAEAGMPLYGGSRVLREIDYRAPLDTELAVRFRDAGFIPVGRASTPEMGSQPATQPLAFGPTRNPWDPSRSPSGSSGGSAAAVAAGLVPIAHASDGYGSIRDPASWCGLVGLKPSRGRNPLGTGRSSVGMHHVVTRSVRDTAAVLDCISGPEHLEQFHAPVPQRRFAEEVGADPGKLRIGVLAESTADDVIIHPDSVAAAATGAKLLESLGHHVDDGHPERVVDEPAVATLTLIRCCGTWAANSFTNAMRRQFRPDEVEPYTWAITEIGRRTDSATYIRALEREYAWSQRVQSWWDTGYDLLLTPTTGQPPLTIEEMTPPPDNPIAIARKFHSVRCLAAPWNVTGQPAMSLPLHWTSDGLPVGVQLVARWGREDLLLRVGAQLEEAAPWSARRPAICAAG